METVIVAALSLAGTLAGAYLANRRSSALIAYRLEQLEQKVNKHNNLVGGGYPRRPHGGAVGHRHHRRQCRHGGGELGDGGQCRCAGRRSQSADLPGGTAGM